MRIAVLSTGCMAALRVPLLRHRASRLVAEPAEEHSIPGSGGIFRDMHVHDFDLDGSPHDPRGCDALRVAVACDISRAEGRAVEMAEVP